MKLAATVHAQRVRAIACSRALGEEHTRTSTSPSIQQPFIRYTLRFFFFFFSFGAILMRCYMLETPRTVP